MKESRVRLLVLHAKYTDQLSYFDDWSDALQSYQGFDTALVNIVPNDAEPLVKAALKEADAVVLLHSTNGDTTMHLDRHVARLAMRRCVLVSFVGNELNLPGAAIAGKRKVLGSIRPEWVATQLLQEAGEFLFADVASRGVVSIPHALNSDVFRPSGEVVSRPIDIGTRVTRYLPHLGDDDRNRIADKFIHVGRERGWSVDISNQRYNREGWAAFLNRCKGTVSSEAGGWFIERDDQTVNAIRDYIRRRVGGLEIANDSALLKLGYRLPKWLRRALASAFRAVGGRYEYQAAEQQPSHEEIYARFFFGKPRPAVYGKCISSRHFDAAGTKTCQIMFRGRFNDILIADEHYLALDDDFGNLDDVIDRFMDPEIRAAMVERTYTHVMTSHTYRHRMQQLETLLRSA